MSKKFDFSKNQLSPEDLLNEMLAEAYGYKGEWTVIGTRKFTNGTFNVFKSETDRESYVSSRPDKGKRLSAVGGMKWYPTLKEAFERV